jgi:CRP-like cAMP-binding protein
VQAHLNATSNVKRVDIRLLALLWYIAERWGRMTSRGAVVTSHLTHTQLASLVGARRPSVTTSLKRLEARGLIAREGEGVVVLDPPAVAAELDALCFSDAARHLRLVRRV